MSDTPNLRNIKNIDGGGAIYIVTGNDDVVNVDTSVGAKTLQIPNIKDGKLQLFYKPIYVNDTGNNAAANVIRVQTTGGDLINGSPFIDIDINGAAVKLIASGLNTWLAVFGSATSPSGADEKVAVNGTDVLPEFLEKKLVQGTNITLDVLDNLGVKSIRINSTGGSGGIIINKTVFVSENGDDLTGAVSDWSKPFRTIAAASAAAAVEDTIYVFAGSYTETITPFQSQKFYYLEAGAKVLGAGIDLIADQSSTLTFYIFGHGELIAGEDQNIFNIQDSSTSLHLECFQLTNNAGTSLGNLNNSGFYIKADKMLSTSGNYSWFFAGSAKGTLLFDTFDARNGSPVVYCTQQGQPGDRATVLFKGNYLISGNNFRDAAFEMNGNLFSRFIFEVINYDATQNNTYTFNVNNSLTTSGETILQNSTVVAPFIINCDTNSNVLIDNCKLKGQDELNATVRVQETTDLITLKNTYVEALNIPLNIAKGANLQAFNCQFNSLDTFPAFRTFGSDLENSIIILSNCQFYTGNGILGLGTSLAVSNLRILSSCSSNQPVQAEFINDVAGTNIVVDAQAILLKQITN